MSLLVEKYTIQLDLFENFETFKGKIFIEYSGKNEELILDAKDMVIESLNIENKQYKFHHDRNRWKLHIEEPIPESGIIFIEYRGRVSEGLQGLYHAGFGEEDMLSTQFASNSAREMIPCFDTPAIKAVFSLTVKINSAFEAISNMPAKNEKLSGNTKEITFDDTPRMSSYLLYLGIGKFTSKTLKYRNVDIILTVPGNALKSNDFPLETAAKSIEFYEKVFEIEYPLPKMHLISVPEFAAGAMENWGAITFREEGLLVNESTDAERKTWIATTIAHEIAHMWFGNLVTMKWWDDIWLNESFATFTSFLCVDSIYPEMDVWKSFYRKEYEWALSEDCLMNSHPIEAKVKEPEEIEQIFDGISYGKGSALLRMMYNFVGKEKFLKGVSDYLKEFKYGNAEGYQLWEHIEKASGKPVVKIALEWIKKQGFPVISVEQKENGIKLRQERFLLKGNRKGELLPVPIIIRKEKGEERVLMDSEEMIIPLEGFVKLNGDASGFFLTSYDDSYYRNLESVISRYSDLDRSDLVKSAYMFLIQGKLSADDYLNIINIACDKPFSPSMNLITTDIGTINSIVPEDEKFKVNAVKYLHRMRILLGEKNAEEDMNTTMMRNSIKERLAILDETFAKEISVKFEHFYKIEPDERLAVSLAKSHFVSDLSLYIDLIKIATSDSDITKLIYGMCHVKGEENYREIFRMVREQELKKQESITAYTALCMNEHARTFMLNNLEEAVNVLRKFFEASPYAGYLITVGAGIIGLDHKEEIRRIISKVNGPDIENGVKKGLEYLEIYQKMRDNWASLKNKK